MAVVKAVAVIAPMPGMDIRMRKPDSGARPGPTGVRVRRRGCECHARLPASEARSMLIRYAKIHGTKHRPWLTALLARRPTKVAAIALANKIARMVWAMM